MKTNIDMTGRVELSPDEVREAAYTYLKSQEKELTKAIHSFLTAKGLKPTRIIYSKGQVIAEISQKMGDDITIPQFSPVRRRGERKMSKGWRRRRVGFTKFVREFIAKERKTGRNKMALKELMVVVNERFRPKLDHDMMVRYILDKRAFPGVHYHPENKSITF